MLNFIGVAPFSPAIIPQINKKDAPLIKKTVAGMEKFASDLIKTCPQTIIFVSPRGPMRYDKFTINIEKKLNGSFAKFGIKNNNDHLSYTGNYKLAKTILKEARKSNFPIETIQESEIDYGTLTPLSFATKKFKTKPQIINITFTHLNWKIHYELGKILKNILSELEENIALVVSGDLSQRISDKSPEQYSPYGIKFDQTLIKLLKSNETEKILKLNPDFCQEAGEIGLRSIIIALGATNSKRTKFDQMSYESPLGSGYLVGRWTNR